MVSDNKIHIGIIGRKSNNPFTEEARVLPATRTAASIKRNTSDVSQYNEYTLNFISKSEILKKKMNYNTPTQDIILNKATDYTLHFKNKLSTQTLN